MNRLSLTAGFVIALVSCVAMAESPEEKPTMIPLDQIWALQMPGTRDIGELEADKPPKSMYGPLVEKIRRALDTAREEGKDAKAAFAVLGTGLDALREAHAVLVQEKKPRETFPSGSEISVVFFSHSFGSYVHLDRVQRRDNVIEIHYRFVPHKTSDLTEHIAIVPLGALPAGEYQITVIQEPMDERFINGGFRPVDSKVAGQVVSGSFRFSVAQAR